MSQEAQSNIFSQASDVGLARLLLADLHDDLAGKIARFHQLSDLSIALGSAGTMMPGGETAYTMWTEARSCFVHGNYVATVLLCQSLAEHMLAAHLSLTLGDEELPNRVAFHETLRRSIERNIVSIEDAEDLRRLMALRNPLAHFRNIRDPSNLSRRVLTTLESADDHLLNDATYAISMAIRLMAMPAFRLGD